MSSLAERRVLSAADYLAGEAAGTVRHEFVDGFAYAMAGADEAHVTVAGNVFALSDSTEAYDRGEKFEHYRLLPSLEQYCLIDPRRRSVEVFTRRDDGWLLRPAAAQGRFVIASLDFTCDLDAVYEDVRFAPDPAPDTD